MHWLVLRKTRKNECSKKDTVEKENFGSPAAIFKKDRCIMCQKEDENGPKMLAVARKLEDKSLFLQLN